MNNLKVLTNGIFKENPTFALLLGMCPTLGVTAWEWGWLRHLYW